MAILNVNDQNFNQVVLDPNKLVIVDFYADWCGPCRMLSPVLKELDDEFGDEITIAKVNVDLNTKTARSYQVMGIPTLKFFKHGKEVGTFTGFKSKDQLHNLVKTILK